MKKQAITWAMADTEMCRHIASLDNAGFTKHGVALKSMEIVANQRL